MSLLTTKISKNVKRLRESKKLSQFDLAKRSGVSLNTVVFLENERSCNPTVDTVNALAKGLSVPFVSLLK